MPQVIRHFSAEKTSYLCLHQEENVYDIIPDVNTSGASLLHGGQEMVSGAPLPPGSPCTMYPSLGLSSPSSGNVFSLGNSALLHFVICGFCFLLSE